MSLSLNLVCLIVCHGGPADHFAIFAEHLVQEGYAVQVYAASLALKKFQDRNIPVTMSFNADNLSEQNTQELASQIAKSCSHAAVVLTDVGHDFDTTLQQALTIDAPLAQRFAYYDNPEPYVPGYLKIATKVMLKAEKVLFANANLATDSLYEEPNIEIKLPITNRVGIGYYPINQAEKMAVKRREKQDEMRAQFFATHNLKDHGQQLLVYFGGNNDDYFQEAFPAFLRFLSQGMEHTDLSNYVIVMQQHPGAKSKNIDVPKAKIWIQEEGGKPRAPKVVISSHSSEEMQVVANKALYYQTSMGLYLLYRIFLWFR